MQTIDYEEVKEKISKSFGITLTEPAIASMRCYARTRGVEIDTTADLIRWIEKDSKKSGSFSGGVVESAKLQKRLQQGSWS